MGQTRTKDIFWMISTDYSPTVPRRGSASGRVEGIALEWYLTYTRILWRVGQC
jgi:hypothetical protein